jgi:hypothetical protein
MPLIEETSWNPPRKRPSGLPPIKLLLNMDVGQVLRIDHQNLHCVQYTNGAYSCSLANAVYILNKSGKYSYEQYHEQIGIAVVRRLK